MNKITSIHAVLAAAFAFTALTACGDDKGDDSGGSTGTPPATDPTNDGTSGSSPTETPDETTNNPSDVSTSAPETTNNPSDPTTGEPPGGFVFDDSPYDAYTQTDRHGAVEAGTAGIGAALGLGLMGEDLSIRDAYNASNPVEDIAQMWLPEIGKSLTFFHDNLDDDLMMLGLTPCDVPTAAMQAGPVVIPDAIKYNPAMPTGYPNGRNLEDKVVDITLAAVLLDLNVHGLDTFSMAGINPQANDVPFAGEFPFLAPPHLP